MVSIMFPFECLSNNKLIHIIEFQKKISTFRCNMTCNWIFGRFNRLSLKNLLTNWNMTIEILQSRDSILIFQALRLCLIIQFVFYQLFNIFHLEYGYVNLECIKSCVDKSSIKFKYIVTTSSDESPDKRGVDFNFLHWYLSNDELLFVL